MAGLLHCDDIHSFLVQAWNTELSSLISSFWRAGVVGIVWFLWQSRNKSVFDGINLTSHGAINFVKVAFREMESNFPKLGSISNTWSDYLVARSIGVAVRARVPPSFISVHWWPPVAPWIKVNTDGSASGAPGNIAAGAVFRDHRNWVRGCFHFKGGKGFAFEAELLAVMTAIHIAHSRGWFQLWLEADSTYVVGLLHARSCEVPWRFLAAWKRTLGLIGGMRLQVSHIFREGNKPADIMANPARSEGWWPYAIDVIKEAVTADMSTHSFVRMVH